LNKVQGLSKKKGGTSKMDVRVGEKGEIVGKRETVTKRGGNPHSKKRAIFSHWKPVSVQQAQKKPSAAKFYFKNQN